MALGHMYLIFTSTVYQHPFSKPEVWVKIGQLTVGCCNLDSMSGEVGQCPLVIINGWNLILCHET